MRACFARAAMVAALLATQSTQAEFNLADTPFNVASTHGMDPYLVYSVALAESALANGKGGISPWPWTVRNTYQVVRAQTREEAEHALETFITADPKRDVDVGLMQINLRWHGHRVENAASLLDPAVNIAVATEILQEAMNSAPDDRQLGIGRYHAWKNIDRARSYGARILAIYNNLLFLKGQQHETSFIQ